MNKLNYHDADDVFALNPAMKINVNFYETFFPIITIDDFYLHPEKVRNIAFKIPLTKGRISNSGSGYPGKRLTLDGFIDSKIFSEKLEKIFTDNVPNLVGLEISDTLIFNIFDTSLPLNGKHYSLPHTDPCEFASLIYLNYEDEPVPGTYLYKHKQTNLPMLPSTYHQYELLIKYMNRTNPGKFSTKEETLNYIRTLMEDYKKSIHNSFIVSNNHVLSDTDEWEIHTKTEPKFNRFMSYMGGMFHSAAIDYDYFTNKEYVRLNQVLFNNEIKNIG